MLLVEKVSALSLLWYCASGIVLQHPVILVPGDGGSRLQVKLNLESTKHYVCPKYTSTFKDAWINPSELAPGYIDCFVDNLKLRYNRTAHTTSNRRGVETHIPDFGDVTSIEWFSSRIHFTERAKYFRTIIETLEKFGYKRDVSLRGVPYDFRKAPNEMEDLFKNFKNLVEETYRANGDKPCVIIGHSMGNMVTLFFLQQRSQEWKDKYIHAFITLSAPWGGSVEAFRLEISGFDFRIPILNGEKLRSLQRSLPSSAWMLPYRQFWGCHEPIIMTSSRFYTACDYEDLFKDLQFEDGLSMRKDTENLLSNLKAPGVTVHCLYGSDVDTDGILVYNSNTWDPDELSALKDAGDGTVNIRSLTGCMRWVHQQDNKIYHSSFRDVGHQGILHNSRVLQYISKVLFYNEVYESQTQTSLLKATSGINRYRATVVNLIISHILFLLLL